MINSFHEGMKARVRLDGKLTDEIDVIHNTVVHLSVCVYMRVNLASQIGPLTSFHEGMKARVRLDGMRLT